MKKILKCLCFIKHTQKRVFFNFNCYIYIYIYSLLTINSFIHQFSIKLVLKLNIFSNNRAPFVYDLKNKKKTFFFR